MYRRKGSELGLDAAIHQFRESLNHHTSRALDRLSSGVLPINLHAKARNWLLAHRSASATVSLIPILTIRSLGTSYRLNLLTEGADLASDATVIALMSEKPPYEGIRLWNFVVESSRPLSTKHAHL